MVERKQNLMHDNTIKCCRCDSEVCTVESCHDLDHGNSVEMSDGRWVCSEDCWHAVAGAYDGLVVEN